MTTVSRFSTVSTASKPSFVRQSRGEFSGLWGREFPSLFVMLKALAKKRPLLRLALREKRVSIARLLQREEDLERERDRRCWNPLRREVERWRLGRKS